MTLVLPLLILFLAGCTSAPPKLDTAPLASSVDQLLHSAVEKKQVPGAVAIVANSTSIFYEGAAAMDKSAIVAIASMTKPITSAAVMQLVESGKIKLDDPASHYAPELADLQVLENGKLRPPKSPVTVRHLLAHTAGFGYEFMNQQIAAHVKAGKTPSIMAGGDGFLKAPLLFDPGTRWEYGINTDWLGRIVEKVSGKNLAEYFHEHIFQPLGMHDSFFVVPEDKKARLAAIHQRTPDGGFEPGKMALPPATTFFSGGGGLFSTALDYTRFCQAILSGKYILKPQTVDSMGENQIADQIITPFRSLVPQFATDGAELPGSLDKFGLGFALNSNAIEGGRGRNTMAWAGIFNTFFWIDRERKTIGILLTQMSPGLDPGPNQLLEDFDRAVYSWRK
ncbi:MAG: beta-lactamase family protein [Acidimicrobiia bacterium]|nr:beta-lactamase family protein [Acidimicrobiia bacterium]